jgi:predicted ArsR family transcriptional regulator
MQPTTSDLILQYIDRHPFTPPREMARALNLTITDIRYHLQRLVEERLIEPVHAEATGRPGRPANLYRLTPANHPAAMQQLTQLLLQNIPVETLTTLASELVPKEISNQPSMVVRISRFIQHLNELGYGSRWEPRPALPRVEFRHCPYASLRQQQPICCELDRLQLAVAARCRVTRLEENARTCLFQLHPEEPAE